MAQAQLRLRLPAACVEILSINTQSTKGPRLLCAERQQNKRLTAQEMMDSGKLFTVQ